MPNSKLKRFNYLFKQSSILQLFQAGLGQERQKPGFIFWPVQNTGGQHSPCKALPGRVRISQDFSSPLKGFYLEKTHNNTEGSSRQQSSQKNGKQENPGHISFSKHSLRAQGPTLNPPGGNPEAFPGNGGILRIPPGSGAGNNNSKADIASVAPHRWSWQPLDGHGAGIIPPGNSPSCQQRSAGSAPPELHRTHSSAASPYKKHLGLPPYLTHPQQARKWDILDKHFTLTMAGVFSFPFPFLIPRYLIFVTATTNSWLAAGRAARVRNR